MANWEIKSSQKNLKAEITLPSSKSLSNRALILQKVLHTTFGVDLKIENLSMADDSRILLKALEINNGEINVKNAGTCMRFLTAYFAATEGSEIILTGDERMKIRPIADLVNVLRQLGAQISYLEIENYPPIKISGQKLKGGNLLIEAHETSQFVSAMMMIAPLLTSTLTLQIEKQISSLDYIEMTAKLMEELGFNITLNKGQKFTISIEHSFNNIQHKTYTVEADWSSAAFFYEAAALSQTSNILLKGLSLNSKQGDKKIAEYMGQLFPIKSTETAQGILIEKENEGIDSGIHEINLLNYPDLAPPIISCAAAAGLQALFSGLSSLKLKESDRFQNLQQQLQTAGYTVSSEGKDSICVGKTTPSPKNKMIFNTRHDHRLTMCFSLLALQNESIGLNEIESVEKSFPGFWEEIKKLGIEAREI